MTTTVIHHSADYDGIFCREIARKFLPDAELIGWDFADKPLPIPDGRIYILDLPVDRVFGFDFAPIMANMPGAPDVGDLIERLTWIDHHASSIGSHPTSIPGYRIDGVAACRLAWFYFTAESRYKEQTVTADFTWFQGHYPWASKQDFIDRKLHEPLAVRLAGEYDIWDKRDPRADTFQFGLRSRELTDFDWVQLLSLPTKPTIRELEELISVGHENILEADGTALSSTMHGLLENGLVIQRYQKASDAGTVEHRSFIVKFEGLKFLALTTARCNSNTFAALDVPETGHDGLMGFWYNGEHWNFSLYHASHRKELDLSQIAVKYGGGGHRGACGFRTPKLPF